MHSLLWAFKLPKDRSMKAELLLSQVQTPGAWSACMQQAAILQQQHKQQKQKLPETPIRMEGSPGHPKKLQFCKL
jgi:hypothetical protein